MFLHATFHNLNLLLLLQAAAFSVQPAAPPWFVDNRVLSREQTLEFFPPSNEVNPRLSLGLSVTVKLLNSLDLALYRDQGF